MYTMEEERAVHRRVCGPVADPATPASEDGENIEDLLF
jgi:hypothetical protein